MYTCYQLITVEIILAVNISNGDSPCLTEFNLTYNNKRPLYYC